MMDFTVASSTSLVKLLESKHLNADKFLLALIKKVKQNNISDNQHTLILNVAMDAIAATSPTNSEPQNDNKSSTPVTCSAIYGLHSCEMISGHTGLCKCHCGMQWQNGKNEIDCTACDHAIPRGIGHCYMFRTKPEKCKAFKPSLKQKNIN